MYQITFVITSFNRKNIIKDSINSILEQESFDERVNIVIVDDKSTDDTVVYLKKLYKNEIKKKQINLISLEKNVGVSGAKNEGFKFAKSDWVIFLDSDDRLIPNILDQIYMVCTNSTKYPLVFFRCINNAGKFIGRKFSFDKEIDIFEYLEYTSYGEALTMVNKKLIKEEIPYVSELRGYEGLGCSRLIYKYKKALLSKLTARIYYQDNNARLSSGKGFLSRLLLLSNGHRLMLKEFRIYMPFKVKLSYFFKIIIYYILGKMYNTFVRIKNG